MSSSIQNYYPSFVPNQVLTDTQLNELRTFLDQQDHLTRNRLIGTGIVCGLHAHYTATEKKLDQESHVIAVSSGLGITSDGYLIEINALTYSRFRKYEGIDKDGDKTMDYPYWRDAVKPVYELVPDQPDAVEEEVKKEPEKIFPLEEQYIRSHVLVLYVEPQDESLKSCRMIDCSNKGARIRLSIKALLVHESDLVGIPKSSPLSGRMLHIPRFHTALPEMESPNRTGGKLPPLATIGRTDDIRHAYGIIILKMLTTITEVLDKNKRNEGLRQFLQVYPAALKEVWGRGGDDPMIEVLERLQHYFPEGKDASDYNQYHYDFIRDLVVAINEFEVAWARLIQSCQPPAGFPRHLMIRRFESIRKTDGTIFRNDFQPAVVRNQMYQDWDYTRSLFLRILYMVMYFDMETVATYGDLSRVPDIRITPGQTGAYALGEQAIPFYYRWPDTTAALYTFPELWQPLRKTTPETPLSFHRSVQVKGDNYQNAPLRFDLQQKSFYQIEGHLGKTPGEVMEFLRASRMMFNLDFDVVLFYLAPSIDEVRDPIPNPLLYKDYVDHLTGMEHLNGVAPGDTLILLADPRCPGFDDDVVVADFTLKGKLTCCLNLESEGQTYYSEPKAKMEVHVFDEEKYYFGNATVELRRKGEQTVIETKITPSQTKGDGSTREGIVSFEGLTEKVGYELVANARKGNDLYGGSIEATASANGRIVELILYRYISDPGPVVDVEVTVPPIVLPVIPGLGVVKSRGLFAEDSEAEAQTAPEEKEKPASDIFPERRQGRVKAVFAFNQGGDYQRNRTYQSVQELVSDDKLAASALNTAFRDTAGKLKSVYKRATGQKQSDYGHMLQLIFLAWLDRIVETTPTALPTEAREIITSEAADWADYGLSAASVKKAWNATALKKATEAGVIDQINRLLK